MDQLKPLATALLTRAEVALLDQQMGARADRLIAEKAAQGKPPAKYGSLAEKSKSGRGRPVKTIANPFAFLIGPTTGFGRYPYFTQEIIEGVARLDWHGRGADQGSSKPLSVRKIMVILESLPQVTSADISELFGFGSRQAQRYLKAIELAMPYLTRSMPGRLRADIGGAAATNNCPSGMLMP